MTLQNGQSQTPATGIFGCDDHQIMIMNVSLPPSVEQQLYNIITGSPMYMGMEGIASGKSNRVGPESTHGNPWPRGVSQATWPSHHRQPWG